MLTKNAILTVAQAEAQAAGLRVEYYPPHHPRPVPCTDGGRLLIQEPGIDWPQDRLDAWLDALSHEIGHNLPQCRDAFQVAKTHGLNMQSLTGFMVNLVEDNRVDHTRTLIYPGTRRAYESTFPALARRNMQTFPLRDDAGRVLYTLMDFDAACRSDWGIDAGTDDFNQRADSLMKEWRIKLDAYRDRYHTSSAEESLELVKELLRDVFNVQDPEAFKPASGKGKGQSGEPESEDGDGDEESDNAKDGKGKVDPNKPMVVKVKDAKQFEEYFDDHREERKHSRGGPHLEYAGGSEKFVNRNPSLIKVVLPSELTDPVSGNVRAYLGTHYKTLPVESMVGAARRYLQAKTQTQFLHNLPKGKIDVSKLHKLAMERSEYRVFKERRETDALDTAVYILADWSGSMDEESADDVSKRAIACSGLILLSKLCQTLHIPHECALFTEDYSRLYHFVVKPSTENSVTDTELLERCCQAYNECASGNSDSESIEVAANRLAAMRAKRHVMIVLSDGCPAGGGGDTDWATKRVVKYLESLPNWSIIGLGIEDENVKLFYTNHLILKRASELPEAILETLKRSILEIK